MYLQHTLYTGCAHGIQTSSRARSCEARHRPPRCPPAYLSCTRGGVAPTPLPSGDAVLLAAASLCIRSTKRGRSSSTRVSCHTGTMNGAAARACAASGCGKHCQCCCCSAHRTWLKMWCAHKVGSSIAWITHAGGRPCPGHPQGSNAVEEAKARNCAAVHSRVWAMPRNVAAASCRFVTGDEGMCVLQRAWPVGAASCFCCDCCPGAVCCAAPAKGAGSV